MVALLIDQKGRVEDGEGTVRVERGVDLGDPAKVGVEPLDRSHAVVDRTVAGHASDVELAIRVTEGVLRIDDEHADPDLIAGRRRNAVVASVVARCGQQATVVDPPGVVDDAERVVEGGKWVVHCRTFLEVGFTSEGV